ncbi:MAG: MBL fold metallo-hydrolase [Oscillospiraceae bacterium]
MNIKKISVGSLDTNCYLLLSNKENAIIIDPGDDYDKIETYLSRENCTLKYILLTHGHFDHIGAVKELLDENISCKLLIHNDDADILQNQALVEQNLSEYNKMELLSKVSNFIEDNDIISLDDISLKVLHTPGHTKGSCVFYDEQNNVMFTGDTLFSMSVGRTDLYGGSFTTLKKSLEKITTLNGDYEVFPGHGEKTTLQKEKDTNPFLGGISNDDYF